MQVETLTALTHVIPCTSASSVTHRCSVLWGVSAYAWDAPIEVAVTLGLLIQDIGVSALVGMGVLFSLVPLQSYFSRRFAAYRRKAVHWTDLRIKTINEILTGTTATTTPAVYVLVLVNRRTG